MERSLSAVLSLSEALDVIAQAYVADDLPLGRGREPSRVPEAQIMGVGCLLRREGTQNGDLLVVIVGERDLSFIRARIFCTEPLHAFQIIFFALALRAWPGISRLTPLRVPFPTAASTAIVTAGACVAP